MSRPVSAAGEHSRGRVSNKTPLAAPSMMSLFIANLRILDLDLRIDWPGITVKALDTKDAHQDQKRRVQCVEWALFRLFEMFEPSTTRDKLQPFFPPLEPLQSLNLRAALYRCLDALKKTGVLGREVMLRKTMLDECKGEKFEEVLLFFSAVVVRKRILVKRSKAKMPLAQRVACQSSFTTDEIANLFPLVLAHRRGVSSFIARRVEQNKHIREVHDVVKQSRTRIERRRRLLAVSKDGTASSLSAKAAEDIRRQVRESWIGSSESGYALLNGSTAPSSTLAMQPFADLWHRADPQSGALQEDQTLSDQLESRVTELNRRLSKWQHYQASKGIARDNDRPKKSPGVLQSGTQPGFSFTKHQSVRVKAGKNIKDVKDVENGSVELRSDSRSGTTSRFDHIVQNMMRDIAAASSLRRRPIPMSHQVRERPLPGMDSITQGVRDVVPPLDLHAVLSLPRPEPVKAKNERDEIHAKPAQQEVVRPAFGKPITNDQASDIRRKETVATPPEHSQARFPAAQDTGSRDEFSSTDRPGQQSLSARTQQSMAGNSSAALQNAFLPSHATLDHPSSPSLVMPPLPPPPQPKPEPTAIDRRTSLADRTRRTIFQSSNSHALAPESTSRKAAGLGLPHAPFPPSVHQAQQFETPIKGNRANIAAKRNVTPKADLFSDDAEYASVFKSRPRIAVSPVLSPALDDGRGFGEFDEDGTPLAGRGN